MTQNTADITVLGRNYTVACPPEQRQRLQAITAELNSRLNIIKNRTGSGNADQLLVMAALNLLNEHDEIQNQYKQQQSQLQQRIKALEITIDQRLSERFKSDQKNIESDN